MSSLGAQVLGFRARVPRSPRVVALGIENDGSKLRVAFLGCGAQKTNLLKPHRLPSQDRILQ